ncbi:MAG: flagellar basal body L-ring protein FlgH [Desulfopila sp.]
MKNTLFSLTILLLLAGCARQTPQLIDIPEPLEESHTPERSVRTPGSLWTSESTSMYSDLKARNVGDIVTIIISESSSASKQATTSTARESGMGASIPNLFGLENSSFIQDSNLDLNNMVSSNFANSFDGEGTTTRKGNLSASLTTQVIERYPNGNLKIRGGKEVMVNNEVQIIYLTGIIRAVDITAGNTIPSSKVLNARITYTGQGAIADNQQPGWLMRALDRVWPF